LKGKASSLVELKVCAEEKEARKKEKGKRKRRGKSKSLGKIKGLHRICSDDLSKRYLLGLIIFKTKKGRNPTGTAGQHGFGLSSCVVCTSKKTA